MAQPYTKPYKTPRDLVAHLESRGLVIGDTCRAEQKIQEIGYSRLRIYFLSRRDIRTQGKPFRAGINFDDIIKIYNFDEELRLQCFRWVGQFEILFRNAIAEHLSSRHGAHPYFDDTVFASTKDRQTAQQSLTSIFHKNSQDPRARHYFQTYNPPMIPPIWTMKEIMSFGAMNHFFNLLSNPEKTAIASTFNVSSFDVFSSWIKSLIDLRNVCAHHDRLFNRQFQKQPKILKRARIPTAPSPSLKALLECLQYMLVARGYPNSIISHVDGMIGACPEISPREVGFWHPLIPHGVPHVPWQGEAVLEDGLGG